MESVEVLRHRAQLAAEAIYADRDAAERRAREVIADNGAAGDASTTAVAERVLAVVALHRGEVDVAAQHIDRSVVAADESGDATLVGQALLTRTGVRAMQGAPDAALADADRATPLLDGDDRVKVRIQRATVLATGLGRIDEAVAEYDDVLADLDDPAPPIELTIRMNRGVQLLARGDLERAMLDIERSRSLFLTLGNQQGADEMNLHLAQAAARTGDVLRVFDLHAECADRGLFDQDDPRAAIDICDALRAAGLMAEATTRAEQAIEAAARTQNRTATLEATLLLADIKRAEAQPTVAAELAASARVLATEIGHDAWSAAASVQQTLADVDQRSVEPADVARLVEAAIGLDASGWAHDATDVRLTAVEFALRLDRHQHAASLLPDPLPSRSGPRAARAQALRHLTERAPGSARRVLAQALRQADARRTRLASDEARGAAPHRVAELSRLGLELAFAAGRPRDVLAWTERQRAAALRLAVPSSTAGADHAEALDRLRNEPDLAPSEVAALERQVTRRRRTHRADDSTVTPVTAVAELVAALGDRTLVSYLVVDRRLHAIVVRRGRVRLATLGVEVAAVAGLVSRMHFGLRRLSTASGARADAGAAVVDAAALELSRLLVDPLLRSDDGDVVIVPTGVLHQLPWSALAVLQSRSVVVAPSAHLWKVAAERPAVPVTRRAVAVVAGPGLPGAEAEAAAVEASWPRDDWPPGTTATVAEALAALSNNDLVHLVTHGVFRHDSPQFSALHLGDGPLTVHDLDRIDHLPDAVVLSACSLATVDVRRGDELLGFPAALLGRGVRTITAALLPVADDQTVALMTDYHRHLAAGAGPGQALASSANAARERGPAARSAADSFLVVGAG